MGSASIRPLLGETTKSVTPIHWQLYIHGIVHTSYSPKQNTPTPTATHIHSYTALLACGVHGRPNLLAEGSKAVSISSALPPHLL